MGVRESLSKLLPAPLRERERAGTVGQSLAGPWGARDRVGAVVDADELRRVLPEVGAGVRGDQGEAGGGGPARR